MFRTVGFCHGYSTPRHYYLTLCVEWNILWVSSEPLNHRRIFLLSWDLNPGQPTDTPVLCLVFHELTFAEVDFFSGRRGEFCAYGKIGAYVGAQLAPSQCWLWLYSRLQKNWLLGAKLAPSQCWLWLYSRLQKNWLLGAKLAPSQCWLWLYSRLRKNWLLGAKLAPSQSWL
jgi:hypothetical protein